jgi:hypothetical protein
MNIDMPLDLETSPTHHWAITFEALLDKDKMPTLGEENKEDEELMEGLKETDYWVTDTIVVNGGEDARPSIEQVEAHVLNLDKYDEYPLPAIDFRLTGVELLSVSEI